MNKTNLISEMLKFHFGSKIFCSDGDGGVLTQVIFDHACTTHDPYWCEAEPTIR